MRIVDYKMVTTGITDAMNAEVNKLIKKGYQPYGGCSVSNCPEVDSSGNEKTRFLYAQAMVLYEE